jgi:hypothetical protein
MKFGPTLTEWTLRGWIHDVKNIYQAESANGNGITVVNSATVYKNKYGLEAQIVYTATFNDGGMKQIRHARLLKADLVWPKRKNFQTLTSTPSAKIFISNAKVSEIGEYL